MVGVFFSEGRKRRVQVKNARKKFSEASGRSTRAPQQNLELASLSSRAGVSPRVTEGRTDRWVYVLQSPTNERKKELAG